MRYLSDFTLYVLVFVFNSVIAYAPNYSGLQQYPEYYGPYPSRPYSQNFQQSQPRSSRGIPLNLAKQLSSVQSEEELFQKFIEPNGQPIFAGSSASGSNARVGRVAEVREVSENANRDIEPRTIIASVFGSGASPARTRRLGSGVDSITSRFGAVPGADTHSEKKPTAAVLIPRPATCMPEQRTVSLRDSDDPTLYYYPSCTRVDRCGGCCLHDLLSCQPRTTEYLNFSVIVSKYTGKPKLEYQSTKIITVEKHIKCKCECKIKAQDCTPQQKYVADDCRCVCANKEDEAACEKENKIKLWNPSTCSCQCRETYECSSGYYFNTANCSCVPNQKAVILPDYSYDPPNRYREFPPY